MTLVRSLQIVRNEQYCSLGHYDEDVKHTYVHIQRERVALCSFFSETQGQTRRLRTTGLCPTTLCKLPLICRGCRIPKPTSHFILHQGTEPQIYRSSVRLRRSLNMSCRYAIFHPVDIPYTLRPMQREVLS